MRLTSLCPLLLFALSALAPAQDLAARGWTDALVRAEVARLVNVALEEPGAVGFSVGIAEGDRVVHEGGYGLAELEHGAPAGARTMFRIASITKQFSAAMAMRAVEQGRIALDDPIGELVPELDLQGHVVTLRQLLNHTSGMKCYTRLGREWMDQLSLELSHEELIDMFDDEPFDFEPGQDYAYNNSAYYVLGVVIERLERPGKRVRLRDRYTELVTRQLTAPLGLERTRYDSNGALIPDRAQGYRGGPRFYNDALIGMKQPGAAGGLLSTGGDLVRWSMALHGGDVVSPESYTLMTTPTVLPDGSDTGYGFGLAIGEREGQRVIGHAGGIMGFNSMLNHYTDAGLHVAVISNCESADSGELEEAIAEVLLGDPPSAIDPFAPLPPLPDFLQGLASPGLARLASDVQGDPTALDAFWEERQGKGPLIEPSLTEGFSYVTFLWRESEAQRVTLLEPFLQGDGQGLERLKNTNLWFLTGLMSDRVRCHYSFEVLRPSGGWRLADPLQAGSDASRSVLEFPAAPPPRWSSPGRPKGGYRRVELGGRTVLVYLPAPREAESLPVRALVWLEGKEQVAEALHPHAAVFDELVSTGRIPRTALVRVPWPTRPEPGGSPELARFLRTELAEYLTGLGVSADPAHRVLGGADAGAATALGAALELSDQYGAVLAQSPRLRSFLLDLQALEPVPNDLIEAFVTREPVPLRIWMEAGHYEHPTEVVAPSRRLHDVLRLQGYDVQHQEFHGAGELHWQESLPDAISALFGE